MCCDEIEITEICAGCPHTFGFYIGEEEIGHIRYRWGYFQCWPVVNGEDLDNIIDAEGPDGRGIIYENKDEILEYCKEALCNWHNSHILPRNGDQYIGQLIN